MGQTQERLAEAERQAEVLRQQKIELENKRDQASAGAAEAARVASDQTLQLQQQIEFTQRMEALKAEIAVMSEQLTPNHPSLKRAQRDFEAMQLRATRIAEDPDAAHTVEVRTALTRDFLQFEIERLNAQLQEKRKELEVLNAAVQTASGPSMPALIFKRSPEYTPAALKAGIEGSVELGVVISEGRPINIWVMHALGYGLDQKAIECVKTWRWQKGASNSEQLRQTIYVTVPFKLPVQK
jgi:TonB family protein